VSDVTFEAWPHIWDRYGLFLLVLAWALAGGIVGAATSDAGLGVGCLIVVAIAAALVAYVALFEPFRVIVTDTGVVLEARRRRVFVPWSGLSSVDRVESRRGRFRDVRVEWRRMDDSVVNTADDFDFAAISLEIQRRAPHVLLSG
jgi:hypothetical protein